MRAPTRCTGPGYLRQRIGRKSKRAANWRHGAANPSRRVVFSDGRATICRAVERACPNRIRANRGTAPLHAMPGMKTPCSTENAGPEGDPRARRHIHVRRRASTVWALGLRTAFGKLPAPSGSFGKLCDRAAPGHRHVILGAFAQNAGNPAAFGFHPVSPRAGWLRCRTLVTDPKINPELRQLLGADLAI